MLVTDGHDYSKIRAVEVLIGGKFVSVSSRKALTTKSPFNGTTIAEITSWDATGVHSAVVAALDVLDRPWSRAKPYERQYILAETQAPGRPTCGS